MQIKKYDDAQSEINAQINQRIDAIVKETKDYK